MDALGNPALIFSALSLTIILLGISLHILRARMTLLENKLLESNESVKIRLNELQETTISSFDKSNKIKEKLLRTLSGEIEASRMSVSDCVQRSQRAVEESESKLLNSSEHKFTDLVSLMSNNTEVTTKNIKNNIIYTKAIIERAGHGILEGVADSGKALIEQLQSASNSISTKQEKALTELNEYHSGLTCEIEKSGLEKTNKILNCLNEAASNTENLVKESANTLSDTIELVRVSNVLTENRNLYDQGRLVLETETFVKTFDRCELTAIEDKETGQVTRNEYKNGKLSMSKTYRTDSLEYVGYYEDGVLKKMEDLTGSEANGVTQYEYDEAGEVESVI
ncbi:MAG: hypothetical protein RPS47_18390 [Colwellia sp.]